MAYDKVVDSTVLDGYFSDIADAIRDKDGTQNTYTPAQMPQAIEDIPSGGVDANLEDLLAGQATGEVTVKDVESLKGVGIGFYDSQNFNTVTILHLPDTKELCYVGSNISTFSGLIDIGGYAKLQLLDIPECKYLRMNRDNNSTSSNRFTRLTTINAPKLEKFFGCMYGSGITSIDFPLLNEMGSSSMFTACTSLTSVKLKNYASSYGSNTFNGCSSLVIADLGKPTRIMTNALKNCTSLIALVIRKTDAVTALSSSSEFSGEPIANGTGYIYVPRAMVSTYQAATNWSTYSAQFRALEDYTDDGTVDGDFVLPQS